jgi:hypothetical protein
MFSKKVFSANFKKLNDLANAEGCTVNIMITKLLKAYKIDNGQPPPQRGLGAVLARSEPVRFPAGVKSL